MHVHGFRMLEDNRSPILGIMTIGAHQVGVLLGFVIRMAFVTIFQPDMVDGCRQPVRKIVMAACALIPVIFFVFLIHMAACAFCNSQAVLRFWQHLGEVPCSRILMAAFAFIQVVAEIPFLPAFCILMAHHAFTRIVKEGFRGRVLPPAPTDEEGGFSSQFFQRIWNVIQMTGAAFGYAFMIERFSIPLENGVAIGAFPFKMIGVNIIERLVGIFSGNRNEEQVSLERMAITAFNRRVSILSFNVTIQAVQSGMPPRQWEILMIYIIIQEWN